MTCLASACPGAAVDYLGLYSADGFEIAPYLSGVSAAMRFSDTGELALGRPSTGRYRLHLGAAQREWRHHIEAVGGTVSVHLE